jgi:hypothetical protein
MDNFSKVLGFSLGWEGYKIDDPRDPGKLTIFGLSSVYHPVEVAKMAKMSTEEALKYASDLYLKKYWLPAGCDILPYPKDMIIFDVAINPGFKLVMELRSRPGTWQDYLFDRITYYCDRVKKNPAKIVFLRGWINRTIALRNLINKEAGI